MNARDHVNRNSLTISLTLGLTLGLTSACPTTTTVQLLDESSGTTGNCAPGELGCSCTEDNLCLGDLECQFGLCIDPSCMPGSEYCECAEGGLCLGDLTCTDDLCVPGEGEGGGDGDGDGDGEGETESCSPQAYAACVDGDAYWFDSCDEPGAIKDDCDPRTQACHEAGEDAFCVPLEGCPDGEIGPGEDCEGNNLGGQTCESLGYADGTLSCTEFCTFDESACESCGNGVVDANDEECDGSDLQGESCTSQGFTGGQLMCSPSCTFDDGDCTSCVCQSGECCSDGCTYDGSNVECDAEADVEYGCPSGTDPGDDVSKRTRAQFCSGSSASCSGSLGSWESWQVEDNCSWNEYCTPNDPTCNACAFTFDVTQYECNNWTTANGAGPGGGEIIEVCATTNTQTGYMTVKARKFDNSSFSNRPYQVRVSAPGEDPCGPNTWFFVVSDSDPVGIGTSQLTFSFPAQWQPQQWGKAYCVTASTQFGDLGYDPNSSQQQSWWYSDKAMTTRVCN